MREPCPLPHCCAPPSGIEGWLPDLPLHRMRPGVVHSAAGCSPLPPVLPFKPPPGLSGSLWSMARRGMAGAACVPSFQVLRWQCRAPLGQGDLGAIPMPNHRALGEMGLTTPPFCPPSTPSLTSGTLLMGPQSPVLSLCGLKHRSSLPKRWFQSLM